MTTSNGFGKIWIGASDLMYFGRGIIVGPRHVLTCNHVVRDALKPALAGEQPNWGGTLNDRVGQRVKVRTMSGVIEARVFINHPWHREDGQTDPFEDLCLLERCDDLVFPDSAIAKMASKGACSIGNEEFRGQGLGQDEASGRFADVPFEGKLLDEADFGTWHFTNFPADHLKGLPGCSGAAAVAERLPGVILGMMQGARKDRVGMLIPAWLIASFLEKAGLAVRWHEPAPPPTAPLLERPSRFKAIRKATRLGLDDRHLAFCDRAEQIEKLNPVLESFIANDDLSLLVAVTADEDDLPDLFHERVRREGVDIYFSRLMAKLRRKIPTKLRDQSPRMTVFVRSPGDCASQAAVYALIGRSFAGSKIGRLSPDPVAIAMALSNVDAPVFIKVEGPAEVMTPPVLKLWHDCITEIARLRTNAPVLVLLLAIVPLGTSGALEDQEGIVVLPELPMVARADLDRWADNVLVNRDELKWNPAKTAELHARLRADSFTMRQLQEWVSDEAA